MGAVSLFLVLSWVSEVAGSGKQPVAGSLYCSQPPTPPFSPVVFIKSA